MIAMIPNTSPSKLWIFWRTRAPEFCFIHFFAWFEPWWLLSFFPDKRKVTWASLSIRWGYWSIYGSGSWHRKTGVEKCIFSMVFENAQVYQNLPKTFAATYVFISYFNVMFWVIIHRVNSGTPFAPSTVHQLYFRSEEKAILIQGEYSYLCQSKEHLLSLACGTILYQTQNRNNSSTLYSVQHLHRWIYSLKAAQETSLIEGLIPFYAPALCLYL